MRSYTLMAVLLLTCSSFILKIADTHSARDNTKSKTACSPKKILDFTVHRFSGEKVFLSWHTQDDSQRMVYEVLRKNKKLSQFVSLGVVQPKAEDRSGGDYSFVDVNSYLDSSYYCLKRTTDDSIIFFSATKGVEGVGRNR